MGKSMKTDLLTARLLSAYSMARGEEINLSDAYAPEHPKFLASVEEGYESIKRRFAPGAKVEKIAVLGDTRCKVRLSGSTKIVNSSIELNADQAYFDNFLLSGLLPDILSSSYIDGPIETVLEHPIIAGNGIKITKATTTGNMTLFITDRTEDYNLIGFGEEDEA